MEAPSEARSYATTPRLAANRHGVFVVSPVPPASPPQLLNIKSPVDLDWEVHGSLDNWKDASATPPQAPSEGFGYLVSVSFDASGRAPLGFPPPPPPPPPDFPALEPFQDLTIPYRPQPVRPQPVFVLVGLNPVQFDCFGCLNTHISNS